MIENNVFSDIRERINKYNEEKLKELKRSKKYNENNLIETVEMIIEEKSKKLTNLGQTDAQHSSPHSHTAKRVLVVTQRPPNGKWQINYCSHCVWCCCCCSTEIACQMCTFAKSIALMENFHWKCTCLVIQLTRCVCVPRGAMARAAWRTTQARQSKCKMVMHVNGHWCCCW